MLNDTCFYIQCQGKASLCKKDTLLHPPLGNMMRRGPWGFCGVAKCLYTAKNQFREQSLEFFICYFHQIVGFVINKFLLQHFVMLEAECQDLGCWYHQQWLFLCMASLASDKSCWQFLNYELIRENWFLCYECTHKAICGRMHVVVVIKYMTNRFKIPNFRHPRCTESMQHAECFLKFEENWPKFQWPPL